MIYGEILAGGKGTRMGNTEMPKQFLKLGDRPIIIHTIEKFLLQNKFEKVIIVCPKPWISHTKDIVKKYIAPKFIEKVVVCVGGVDRNGSVMSGIHYIEEHYGLNDDDIIVTHDAVRPFLTSRMLSENIEMGLKYGATDTVVSAVDTIVESQDNEFITAIPLRDKMYQGQTPQTFNVKKLKSLFESLTDEEKVILTDAAKIFVMKGEKVKLVSGELYNIKITSQYDLDVANMLISEKK